MKKQKRKKRRRATVSPRGKGRDHSIEKIKELFLKQLAKGDSPGVACRKTKIARSAVYRWAKDDQKFDVDWKDAVEDGLDELETSVFQSGLDGCSSDAQFMLKHRRKEVYGNSETKGPSNYILNITLQEHLKQLESWGLPLPQLEGDYEDAEEMTIASSSATHNP